MDENSLTHTKWDCKYHIVFAPKYRQKTICGKYKADIGKKLRELCAWKWVEIIEATHAQTVCICTQRYRRNIARTYRHLLRIQACGV